MSYIDLLFIILYQLEYQLAYYILNEIEKQNEENIKEANEKNSGDCPKCGEGKLVKRRGKYGPFIGCNNFPKCNHTQKIAKAKTTPTEGEHHKYEMLRSQLRQEVDKVILENPRIQKYMRRYYSTNNNEPDFNPGFTGPISWKMYATKPDGETYEGYKKVDVFNRDSSD